MNGSVSYYVCPIFEQVALPDKTYDCKGLRILARTKRGLSLLRLDQCIMYNCVEHCHSEYRELTQIESMSFTEFLTNKLL